MYEFDFGNFLAACETCLSKEIVDLEPWGIGGWPNILQLNFQFEITLVSRGLRRCWLSHQEYQLLAKYVKLHNFLMRLHSNRFTVSCMRELRLWLPKYLALESSRISGKGLLRELNPGPLAPEARITPLDQAANEKEKLSRNVK